LAGNNAVKKIIVFDNLSRPNFNLFLGDRMPNPEKVQFIKGELLDSRTLKRALKGVDTVYHLAAKVTTPFANADAHLYEQVNHWGTAELVYAVEESDVKRFIYTSSLGVYGSSELAIDESFSPNPKTFYAVSKLRGEEHVRRLLPKLDTYILRCGNVYGFGPSMRFDAVINKFVFEAHYDKRITVHGDGNQSRSFIHIDSISTALASLVNSNLAGGTYNLVERSIKVIDIVDELKQVLPDLEFILINQHLKLHQLNVLKNQEVNRALGIGNERSLKADIETFLKRFSF
jgi:UDP-glucose 4-epimerase